MQDDMKGSLWALACLLSIWAQPGPTGGASASQPLDSMAPLYPALRRVATSLKEPAACLPAYVEVLQQGASSPDRSYIMNMHPLSWGSFAADVVAVTHAEQNLALAIP